VVGTNLLKHSGGLANEKKRGWQGKDGLIPTCRINLKKKKEEDRLMRNEARLSPKRVSKTFSKTGHTT